MALNKNKLIYILNQYSVNSSTHFYHVINLLETMANMGIEIALIIEKCDDMPEITNPNIKLFAQSSQQKWLRPFELSNIIFKLHKQGFSNIFIRISWVAAVVSIITSFFTKQKTFYWLSGQGGFEYYNSLKINKKKIKLFFTSRLSFYFIKKFVYRFVTGPESMKNYFIKEGGVDANKIMILYNDIDIKRFNTLDDRDKEKLKLKLKLPSNKKIIFFAHRFSPVRKTLYYLPFVFENFSEMINEDYIIIIAGSGPEEKQVINAMIKTCSIEQLIFLGNIPNAIIQEYYQVADIFINPTYAEGFPRVLIEAMASGLPIVSTDAGGIRDILGPEQSRYMVEKDDRISFAKKLVELSNNSKERTLLKNENLRTVQKFSTQAVAEMYIKKILT
jgi:glycosyltransferase involved in cell wall biosynthesis